LIFKTGLLIAKHVISIIFVKNVICDEKTIYICDINLISFKY